MKPEILRVKIIEQEYGVSLIGKKIVKLNPDSMICKTVVLIKHKGITASGFGETKEKAIEQAIEKAEEVIKESEPAKNEEIKNNEKKEGK